MHTSPRLFLFLRFLPASSLLACLPPSVPIGELTESGSATTMASSSSSTDISVGTTSADAGEATATPTTTDATTGVPTDTTTDVPTDTTTGSELCPLPEDVKAYFWFDPEPQLLEDASCVVIAIDAQAEEWHATLDCGDEIYVLTIVSTPLIPPHVAVDDTVLLDYRFVFSHIYGGNQWFALRSGDGERTLAGGVSASVLDPPGMTIADYFVDPVLVEKSGLCPVTPARCGDEERLALEMNLSDVTKQLVFDGSVGHIDILSHGAHLVLNTAMRLPNADGCGDEPNSWYGLVFVWLPPA